MNNKAVPVARVKVIKLEQFQQCNFLSIGNIHCHIK
jgi:hypothetical protein